MRNDGEHLTELAGSKAGLYRFLSTAFLHPTPSLVRDLQGTLLEVSVQRYLDLQSGLSDSSRQLIASAKSLSSSLEHVRHDSLEHEYNRLFAHLGSTVCPPYESEYGFENIFQKTQAMADIAGFYGAYELDVNDENRERPDFLATECEFMSYLCLNEAYAREHGAAEQLSTCVDTQKKFIAEHLARWVVPFVKILSGTTTHDFYRDLSRLLDLFIKQEVELLGLEVRPIPDPVRKPVSAPEPGGCDACSPGVQFQTDLRQ